MNRKRRINAARIPHGLGWPQAIHSKRIFVLLLVLLVTLPRYEGRAVRSCCGKRFNKEFVKWTLHEILKNCSYCTFMLKITECSDLQLLRCHKYTVAGSVPHFYRSRCSKRETKECTGCKSGRQTRYAPSVQRLIKDSQVHELNDEPSSNYIEDNWQEGSLHIGQPREPWGSVSMQQQKEINFNFTFNDTKSNQLLTHNEGTLSHKRFKRGVVHLYNMLVCATGCNPLSYKGYGCYCGFLGSGYVIDGIDRCCKMHDWCYDATECPMFSEYFIPYYWRCYDGYKPVCAVEHGNWGASGSCAQRLCECDRAFAECLKRYPCPTTKAVCTSSPWRLVQNLFMVM